MFSVALDAMGGDYGPSETVEAALKIVNEYGYVIYLVGDETQISNLKSVSLSFLSSSNAAYWE